MTKQPKSTLDSAPDILSSLDSGELLRLPKAYLAQQIPLLNKHIDDAVKLRRKVKNVIKNRIQREKDVAIIPIDTILKLRMKINPGKYNDCYLDFPDDYPSFDGATGYVFLDAEFLVLNGQYKGKKYIKTLSYVGIPISTRLSQATISSTVF